MEEILKKFSKFSYFIHSLCRKNYIYTYDIPYAYFNIFVYISNSCPLCKKLKTTDYQNKNYPETIIGTFFQR
jgi:hypothetical protein